MEIFLIVIFFCLAIYFYLKTKKLNGEIKDKELKINDLTKEIGQLQTELSQFQNDNNSLKSKLHSTKTDLANIQITNKELNNKISELSKYQNIIDVKIECEYLLKKAQKDYEKLRNQGNLELSEAQESAKESRRNVKEFTEKKQREIELLYENAVRESKRIIDNAENNAENNWW